MLGPVDYIVVGFKGNNFDGSVLEELSIATQKGTIRVIDLLFIMKDADGNVMGGELNDQPAELKEAFASFGIEAGHELITEEDIKKIGMAMENNTAAGVLVIEQLWAKGLKAALIDAGGELLDEGRIHPEKIASALKELSEIVEEE